MKLTNAYILSILYLIFSLLIIPNLHAEKRQLDSHEHGSGNLMIVKEKKILNIDFEVPSESIIGFEYLPKSKNDRKEYRKAMKLLSKINNLFIIPSKNGCINIGMNIQNSIFKSNNDEFKNDHHSKSKEKHKHKDDHDDHKDEHDDHKDEHDDHNDEIHSEFHAKYAWHCENDDNEMSIQTKLFENFSKLNELKVQWVTEKKQGMIELEDKDNLIKLK